MRSIISAFAFATILFFCSCSRYPTDWKEIQIQVERGFLSEEGYFLSEQIKPAPGGPLPKYRLFEEVFRNNPSPYPLRVVTAKWKIIGKTRSDSVEWGYQMEFDNIYPNDSMYISIRWLDIELLDKDGFTLTKFRQEFKSEPLGGYSIFKQKQNSEEKNLLRKTFYLDKQKAERLVACRVFVLCSIERNYKSANGT